VKKKDIIVIVICAIIIIASIFFILRGFTSKSQNTVIEKKETIDFTGNIDEGAVEKLKKRKDYGSPPMDNIGRTNPFASL